MTRAGRADESTQPLAATTSRAAARAASADVAEAAAAAAASHSGGQQNYAAVNDPVVTRAFEAGNSSIDFATRKKWFDIAQQRVADQVYWIPLFVRQDISIDNGSIVNYKPNPSSQTNEWNTWEWSKAQ